MIIEGRERERKGEGGRVLTPSFIKSGKKSGKKGVGEPGGDQLASPQGREPLSEPRLPLLK